MEYYTNEQLYKYFEDEIERNADKQMEALKAEIASMKKQALEKIKTDLSESSNKEMETRIKDMKTDHIQAMNRISYDYSHQLMQKRQELLERVFVAVKQKLADFIIKPEYADLMKKKLAGTLDKLAGGEIAFTIRKGDKTLKKIIGETCKEKFVINESLEITIGGFDAISKKHAMEIDETLDSALADRKEWFYSQADLFNE
mgnify:CR=1 FL=1